MRASVLLAALLLAGWRPAYAQQSAPLTPQALDAALNAAPQGAEAERLADRVREWFGGSDRLLAGSAAPKVEGLQVAWAIEVPGSGPADTEVPIVESDAVHFTRRLTRIGTTDVYATVALLPHGDAFTWHFTHGTRRLGGGQLEAYETHADSIEQPGVPRGIVTQQAPWKSTIFEGTTRDWWVYVPAQYTAGTPAAVMVFQDGAGVRTFVPTVFDNLIARGEMPVTVGIFIDPGVFADGRRNRSVEYDTLSDRYARFLLEEILPAVEKTVTLRHDPAGRAIAGASSGGICAFTGRLGTPRRLRQGPVLDRQLHQHRQRRVPARGRPQLPGPRPQDTEEADPRLPAGRRQRPRQRPRQLAARQPHAREFPRVRRVRLSLRVRQGLPQQSPRPGDPARHVALAVARLEEHQAR